ncbi:MAG: hypothetical protein JNK94_10060 [Hyphomonadaceae bacterium]|nr:hypothetical protein [Hyphomonadaceae bacterium]
MLLIGACTLLLMAPALLNGRPFLFYDSEQYFNVGERMLEQVGEVLAPAAAAPAAPAEAAPEAGDVVAREGGRASFYGGRSPAYSVFLVGLTALLGMWAVVLAQAFLGAALITRFVDLVLGGRSAALVLLAAAVCSGVSSAGFHAGLMMPDMFAGIGVLALLCLLIGAPRLLEHAVLAGLVFVAATTHQSTLGLLVVLTLSAGLLGLAPLSWKPARGVIASLAAAIVGAVALNSAYAAMVERITGHQLGSAPYLTARLIGDGTGARYLRERCAGSTLVTCAFATDNYHDHNDFLWGGSGAAHNFVSAPPEVQRALAEEQAHFVVAVAAAYPLQQAGASIANAFSQFFAAGVAEIDHGALRMVREPAFVHSSVIAATPNTAACVASPAACAHRPPIAGAWQYLVLIANGVSALALIGLAGFWAARRWGGDGQALAQADRLFAVCVLIVLALVANAAICGVLAGAHDRYQARIAWLAPLLLVALTPFLSKRIAHARRS